MKKSRVYCLFLAVLFLLCRSSLIAQTALSDDLDSYVARAMKTFEVPGLSIGIVKGGKVIIARGYGIRKMGESTPVDENTLFGIGSNTKAFTSAALATLVDEGKLSWDDHVYERLPGFQMYDPYASHEITIRDLLTHRSGMGLGEGDLLFWPKSTFTRDEIIHRLRFMKPASSFRSQFAYDNLMYIAAGQIVAAVSGKSWEDYVRERIFRPLRMTTTNMSKEAFKAGDDFAWPHSKLGGPLRPIEIADHANAAPAGSINSSVAEMSKWLLLQLNHGEFLDREGRLFSERQSREMWAAQTLLPIGTGSSPVAALRPKFSAYGLGWFLRDYHGRKLVGHTGGVAGYVSRVMLVPEENLGIVILTNAEAGGAFDSILFHLLDSYFGVPPTDWIAAFKARDDKEEQDAAEITKKLNAARAANYKPSLPLGSYAGVYNDAWYGSATIRLENGNLTFTLDHTPAAAGDLQHWQFETFVARWRDRTVEDAFVTFTLKPDGAIDHFTMSAVSPLADFSFDYQDLWFTPAKTREK